ncbi:o-succinylbenzoate--CoA ligase [Endozoicomonas ascidiicola]|uniref:o-succinylbenzoate--CoA ligase n=1 Tax=Endozoicomonas ascidiicola TaxID=1698521 RepID=UPI00082FF454|nr:o-succinylbenzoate--CoA ligase [Endozoicomonas ascidiicola]
MTDTAFSFPAIYECPLRYQAIHHPSAVAITGEENTISFTQLDQMVEQCRLYLSEKGLNAGERILFVTEDALKTVVLLFACLRSQWIFSPVNPAFPVAQREYYGKRIGASLIASGNDLPDVIDECFYESSETLNNPVSINISPDAVFDLIATSGTTGTPKAVAHSYKNHFYSAGGSISELPLNRGDTWLLSLPLFHVGGLAIIMRCVLAGATVALFQKKIPLANMLATQRISHLSLVNTQLFRLLEQGVNLHAFGVRYILLGGGVASPALVAKAREQGVNLLTTYGMTEMASQICTGEPEFVHGGVTSGRILPYRKLTLSDDNEILVSGETLAQGYFESGEVTPLIDQSGWFHTGDKGEWCGEQIKINGRIDNMMISGGENIHPEEIEQALLMLPNIVQAVVVAVEHTEFGHRPLAYVQTVDGKLNESEVKTLLTGALAKFKIPEHIRLFPDTVSNSGIKVNRKEFQRLA